MTDGLPDVEVRQLGESVGMALMVIVQVCGRKYNAVVDTAAQISMISNKLMADCRADTTPESSIKIKNAESNSYVDCVVIPNFSFNLGRQEYQHTMAAGPISDDIILGLDFWLLHHCIINLPRQRVEIEGRNIPIVMVKLCGGEWHRVSQVTVAEYRVLPPQCEMIVKVNTAGSDNTTYVTAPFAQSRLLGPAGIVFGGLDAVLLVINDSSEEVILKPGNILTTATELDQSTDQVGEFLQVRTAGVTREEGMGNIESGGEPLDCTVEQWAAKVKKLAVPDHLKKLFDRSKGLLNEQQKFSLGEVLVQYADAFAKSDDDLGKFDLVTHQIPTVDENPVQERQRRTPLKFVKEEEEVLKKMLDGGIIQPSASAWASAPVLVRKKDGTVRYAIDYRKLNAKTVKDAYPLPLISECIDALQGNMWFHALDLASGYWQVGLDPKDAHKTAFITRHGLFEYTRMPFGLCNAPATFQRVMHLVLRGMVWKKLLVYLDDVVILGSSF